MNDEVTVLAAILGAIVGGFMTLIVWAILNWLTHSRNIDLAHAQNITNVEATIDEDALALYGIDLTKPGEHDAGVTPSDRGVTTDRIRYLVAIVNAQNLRFGRNKMGKGIKASDLARMFDEDYMPRLFAQETSREVWRHARRCFRKILRENVDKYLTNHPNYVQEFKARPLPDL